MPPLLGRGPTPGSLPSYSECMTSIHSCDYNSYLSPPLDCKLFEGRDQVSLMVCVACQGASNSGGCWECCEHFGMHTWPWMSRVFHSLQDSFLRHRACPCLWPPRRLPLFSWSGFADMLCSSLGWVPLRRGHPLTAHPVVQLWNSACLSLTSGISFSPWRQVFKTKWLTKLLFFKKTFYFVLGYSRLTTLW